MLRGSLRSDGARQPPDFVDPAQLRAGEVHHLPIVKAFADRIDLVGTINRLVPSEADVDPGTLTLALAQDALSGRDPLYRIRDFFEKKNNARPLRLDRIYSPGKSLS